MEALELIQPARAEGALGAGGAKAKTLSLFRWLNRTATRCGAQLLKARCYTTPSMLAHLCLFSAHPRSQNASRPYSVPTAQIAVRTPTYYNDAPCNMRQT